MSIRRTCHRIPPRFSVAKFWTLHVGHTRDATPKNVAKILKLLLRSGMTKEKLWVPEFNKLILALRPQWDGEIVQQTTKPLQLGHGWRIDVSFYAYPILSGVIDQVRISLSINNRPLHGDSMFDDSDANEFLVITTVSSPDITFRIREEGFYDRFRKSIKIHSEHQTGNALFDKRFNLEGVNEAGRGFLGDDRNQEIITQLLPFEYLQSNSGTLRISELIESPEQLDAARIHEKARSLAELSKK